MIIATDGAGTVRGRTLIGAGKEGQRQNLTLVAKDRDGKPLVGKVILTADGLFTAVDLPESGTATLRLPVANWTGWLTADVRGAHGPHSKGMAMLGFTDVNLDQRPHRHPGRAGRPPGAAPGAAGGHRQRAADGHPPVHHERPHREPGAARRLVRQHVGAADGPCRSPTASSSSAPAGGWSSRR